jgi:hypothetical protein
MSTEARELHRIIRASVRDMLDAYRIQAQAGPVSDQALEEIIFRAALLPSVVRLLLASFLEDVAGADGRKDGEGAR